VAIAHRPESPGKGLFPRGILCLSRPGAGRADSVIRALLGASLILPLAAAQAQTVHFVDRTGDWGVGVLAFENGWGAGLAAADYDDDGDIDLFVPQAEGVPNRLYRNDGAGSFEEIASDVGLASTESARVGLWFDSDSDGRLDLLVANDKTDPAPDSSFRLYRQQGDGTFLDVTAAAGLLLAPIVHPNHHWGGLCAGDLDGDGDLDIFTGQFNGPGRLLRNDGDGTFTDDSAGAGVRGDETFSKHHQCAVEDFDGDGRMDIYVAMDYHSADPAIGRNRLWRNQGDGTFVDTASAWGVANVMNDMGVTLGDYDGDGDFDLYVTNIWLPSMSPPRHSVLYRRDGTSGTPAFTEVSASLGVANTDYGWGTVFFDADRDGDLDLAATNGWRSGSFTTDSSRFFESPGGGGGFLDRSSATGFDDTLWGSSLLAVDLDRDGDLELIQSCLIDGDGGEVRVLDNEPLGGGPAPHWLVVRPRQLVPNRHSIGAKVRVLAGGAWQLRRIAAGTSYMGQEPAEAHFGLGAAVEASAVEIAWPDGLVTSFGPVAADQVWIVDLLFADHFESGDLDRWSVAP